MKIYEIFLTVYASLHLAAVFGYIVYLVIRKRRQRRDRLDICFSRLSDLEERLFEIEFNNVNPKTDEKINP